MTHHICVGVYIYHIFPLYISIVHWIHIYCTYPSTYHTLYTYKHDTQIYTWYIIWHTDTLHIYHILLCVYDKHSIHTSYAAICTCYLNFAPQTHGICIHTHHLYTDHTHCTHIIHCIDLWYIYYTYTICTIYTVYHIQHIHHTYYTHMIHIPYTHSTHKQSKYLILSHRSFLLTQGTYLCSHLNVVPLNPHP